MWQEAKANDRRIKDLMANHKRRAERRRAYHDSKLGDPRQLLRVIGSSLKLYPDAEQFYYHENPENLMSWQGNPDIKIDRFDGRSLLDFVPESAHGLEEDSEDNDELNFERYRDLIEADRLNIDESERLEQVEEEWTKLMDRHQAKLALINKSNKGRTNTIAFDYGTAKAADDDSRSNENSLIYETDILEYVDDLTDKDKEILNAMSAQYGVKSYARLLRVAKKDRDAELKALKKKQDEGKPKDPSSKKGRKKRKRRRRSNYPNGRDRYRRRHSPSYEPYRNGSSTGSSDEDDSSSDSSGGEGSGSSDNSDFVIEFSSNNTEETSSVENTKQTTQSSQKIEQEKKLTPMEKLKLKMREGLEKQIVSDERDKRLKEKEKEVEELQQLAKNQGLPINSFLRPEPPSRPKSERYRSPSLSPEPEKRRPLLDVAGKPYLPRNPSKSKINTDLKRYRSPSSEREEAFKKDNMLPLSTSKKSNQERYRSPSSERENPTKGRYRSPSNSSRRYRSPSEERNHAKRHRSGSREKSSRRRYSSRSPPKHSRSRRSPDRLKKDWSSRKRSRSRESDRHYRQRY